MASVIAALIAILFTLQACSSIPDVLPTNRQLKMKLSSVDFDTGSNRYLYFIAKGHVLNPNDFQLKNINFTYQTFVNGDLVDNGKVTSQQIFRFKSRTEFSFPVRIPARKLGNFVKASRTDGVSYRLEVALTDNRFKRISLEHNAILNLTPVVKQPAVRVQATDYSGQLVLDTEVYNPNSFILVMDNCHLIVANSRNKELFLGGAFAPESSRKFRTPIAVEVPQDKHINVQSVCEIDGGKIVEDHRLPVLFPGQHQ